MQLTCPSLRIVATRPNEPLLLLFIYHLQTQMQLYKKAQMKGMPNNPRFYHLVTQMKPQMKMEMKRVTQMKPQMKMQMKRLHRPQWEASIFNV